MGFFCSYLSGSLRLFHLREYHLQFEQQKLLHQIRNLLGNVIGDSFRGATWVSIHNGGGVGWGEVMNGGFGMVIDGSEDSARHIEEMLLWDVNNGIARRSWARNEGAMFAIKREMERTPLLKVTIPNLADMDLIERVYNDMK